MIAQRGFTLTEVMVTVAIVGILASIAYPSYMEYARRSQRVLALSTLLQLADLLERNRIQTGSYQIDPVTNKKIDIQAQGPLKDNKILNYYNFDKDRFNKEISAAAYVLSLVPTGTQINDICGTLTLTSTGVKTAIKNNKKVDGCWKF